MSHIGADLHTAPHGHAAAQTGARRVPAGGPVSDALADRTSALLAAHVPLSLLMDLADPSGPHSWDLMHAEPQDADWLPARRA